MKLFLKDHIKNTKPNVRHHGDGESERERQVSAVSNAECTELEV